MRQKTNTTINVLKEHYLWIHERLGDYQVTLDTVNGLGFRKPAEDGDGYEVEALNSKTLTRMLRSDFRDKFASVKEMEINQVIYAVLGDLVEKAKQELRKK